MDHKVDAAVSPTADDDAAAQFAQMLARRAAQSEEYVMAHLNDPNFDLRPPPPRYSSVEALKDQSGVSIESRRPMEENAPKNSQIPTKGKNSQIPTKSESTSSSEDYDECVISDFMMKVLVPIFPQRFSVC
jgi:hypothetical protein